MGCGRRNAALASGFDSWERGGVGGAETTAGDPGGGGNALMWKADPGRKRVSGTNRRQIATPELERTQRLHAAEHG